VGHRRVRWTAKMVGRGLEHASACSGGGCRNCTEGIIYTTEHPAVAIEEPFECRSNVYPLTLVRDRTSYADSARTECIEH